MEARHRRADSLPARARLLRGAVACDLFARLGRELTPAGDPPAD